ncbi:DUF1640 domain-containing protein [Polynucleobacter sp. 30F-ANTBAC]|jgi:hypothetical protein|uniref:coiled-coil domain-containing protein n=1 Tax=Polynucleobacter sp. 30F-ANTBAC TaxID=2689095 RepID=UPI001C0DF562|nr:coiled-coil domain-containing protein [Polynucleobacter sp. 30F-ANTBAC]MBU3599183.1 DUF1640 domain-containing protein [Polynucleobacter sp. 30F-ANTBAC]
MIFFDTLQSVNDLTESGMELQQAKSIMGLFKKLIEGQYSHLATKQDLEKLSTECKADICELKFEIGSIKSEIKSIKWMLSAFGAIVIVAIVQHNFIHS